jgi:phenylacetate-CoA ligase
MHIKLPRLREIRTISEVLGEQLRADCRTQLGIKVIDLYSTNEVGIVALECPVSGLLHVQSENLIVEVLNEAGDACEEGQIGRVVITDLHNYATPLIRYTTGDHAEAGPACPCGRGLPTLRKVLGRRRNQALLPDGQRVWAYFGRLSFEAEIPTLRQYQLVQDAVERIRVRLVIEETLTTAQERRLTELIHRALGWPFDLLFECSSAPLDLGDSHKYEDFICLIASGKSS